MNFGGFNFGSSTTNISVYVYYLKQLIELMTQFFAKLFDGYAKAAATTTTTTTTAAAEG